MRLHSVTTRGALTAPVSVVLASFVMLCSPITACADSPQTLSSLPNSLPNTIAQAPGLVPNFDKVTGGIWRGSAPSSQALDALKHDGVKTIVDLRLDGQGVDEEAARAKELGVGYYHFALGFNHPEKDKVRDVLSIMTDPEKQPVFVHCRQGADRTGMLVALYRRLWEGWTFPQAYEEMKKHHFHTFLLAFKQEVARADKQLIASPHSAAEVAAVINTPQPHATF